MVGELCCHPFFKQHFPIGSIFHVRQNLSRYVNRALNLCNQYIHISTGLEFHFSVIEGGGGAVVGGGIKNEGS